MVMSLRRSARTENVAPKTGAHPRALPTEALYQSFVQCVAVVIRTFIRLGLGSNWLQRGFNDAFERATQNPYSPDEALQYHRLHRIGDILVTWYTDADFLDANGQPMALSIDALGEGEVGFSTLSRRFFPDDEPRRVVQELLDNQLLRSLPDGLFKPYGKGAVVPYFGFHHLDRLPVRLYGLFGTILYNHVDRGEAPLRMDREVTEFHLPADLFVEFDEMAKRKAELFTFQINQWLTARSRSRRVGEPTATVSVWLHASAEVKAPAVSKPGRKKSALRRWTRS